MKKLLLIPLGIVPWLFGAFMDRFMLNFETRLFPYVIVSFLFLVSWYQVGSFVGQSEQSDRGLVFFPNLLILIAAIFEVISVPLLHQPMVRPLQYFLLPMHGFLELVSPVLDHFFGWFPKEVSQFLRVDILLILSMIFLTFRFGVRKWR